MDGPQRTLNQNLELSFQFSEESRWQWFVIYTKQVSCQGRAWGPALKRPLACWGEQSALP